MNSIIAGTGWITSITSEFNSTISIIVTWGGNCYDQQRDSNKLNNLFEKAEYDDIFIELKDGLDRLRNEYEVPESHFSPPYVKAGDNQKL